MAFGLLDLSIVTDQLIKLLRDSVNDSALWREEPTPPAGTPAGVNPGAPFSIALTGLAPDAARTLPGCQLSLYLFHIAPDKFYRSTPPHDPRAQTNASQPLGLELHYLLSAHSENSYIEEQQAMSIALKCFHENPSVRATVPGDGREVKLTLSMEPEASSALGQLWQAVATPMRLSVVYRVGVVFLEAGEPPKPAPLARKPILWAVATDPASLPSRQVTGPSVVLTGSGFVAGATEVSLGDLGLRAVADGDPAPGEFRVLDASRLALHAPADLPSGRYLVRVRVRGVELAPAAWLSL